MIPYTYEIILFALAFLALCIATFTDIKKREVPDWLSYGFLIIAVAARGTAAYAQGSVASFLDGIAGGAVFFSLGLLLYYFRQWGGGDAKLMAGLGVVFGLGYVDIMHGNFPLSLAFLITVFIVGALYGFTFLSYYSIKKWPWHDKYVACVKEKKAWHIVAWTASIGLLAFFYGLLGRPEPFFAIAFMPAAMYYVGVFVTTIERIAFLRWVEPQSLTEGDWIFREVVVNGEYICGPKDRGIGEAQLKKLKALCRQGKIKKVLLRTGIPFVPAFLLGFIITVLKPGWMFELF